MAHLFSFADKQHVQHLRLFLLMLYMLHSNSSVSSAKCQVMCTSNSSNTKACCYMVAMMLEIA